MVLLYSEVYYGSWDSFRLFYLYKYVWVLIYAFFCPPYPLNIEPLDARGATASNYIKVTGCLTVNASVCIEGSR